MDTLLTLRDARKRRQLSTTEVGRLVNCDPGNLSRIERGLQMPGRELSVRLFKFYSGEVPWPLIFGIEPEIVKTLEATLRRKAARKA